MKRLLLPTLIIILFINYGFSQDTKKVLFIGNSYTFANNLPQLIHNIALSHGDTLIFDSSAPGGYTFNAHSTNQETLNKINSNNWDYVILQEQSQMPSFPPSQVENDVLPYAETLVNLIRANDTCTTPMFFMTWGRKNGDQANCQYYPPICTYEGMQQRLRESYLLMGQLNDAEVAPVGAAWYQTRLNNPTIALYQPDESHPLLNGSYLAACVFYSSIFHKSCLSSFYPSGIIDTDALILQGQANSIVFDSLTNWFIDTAYVNADFDYVINQLDVQFNNSSSIEDSYSWDFGDGSTSGNANPSHTYQASGNYNVSLVTTKNCETDSTSETINVTFTDILEETNEDFSFTLSPNPANSKLQLLCSRHAESFKIVNLNGQIIRTGKLSSTINTIDISDFKPAIYIFKLEFSERIIQKKLIIY